MPEQTMTPKLSERFDEALVYASGKHRTQARKGGDVPYVGHLLSVASLVIEGGGTETQAIAGLLHDVFKARNTTWLVDELERVVAELEKLVAGTPNA